MKERYWITFTFAIPFIYEMSALFLRLPDYFSWLVWIIFWPLIIAAAFRRLFKKGIKYAKSAVILAIYFAYVPYVLGIIKVKSELFFIANKKYMDRFVQDRDADSISELKEIGIYTFGIKDGYVFFPLDTGSDWCWGYAYALENRKPGSTEWCSISKWEKVDDGWFRWSK